LWCFIIQIIDFINEFWKILEFLLKKYRYLNYKTFSEFQHLLFAFWFFSIFHIFFSILPIYSSQKILKIFVLFYYLDPRFYQRIMQNNVFFQKIWDIWNPKFHQNFIVCLFLFYFLTFSTSFFFLFPLSKLVKKLWNFL